MHTLHGSKCGAENILTSNSQMGCAPKIQNRQNADCVFVGVYGCCSMRKVTLNGRNMLQSHSQSSCFELTDVGYPNNLAKDGVFRVEMTCMGNKSSRDPEAISDEVCWLSYKHTAPLTFGIIPIVLIPHKLASFDNACGDKSSSHRQRTAGKVLYV